MREDNPGIGRIASEFDKSNCSQVEIVRLDDFFKNGIQPDVLKIDVEGHEIEVLKGMQGLFKRGSPKAIMLETHGFYYGINKNQYNSKIIKELNSNGYLIYILRNNQWLPLESPLCSVRSHLLAIRE